MIDTFPILVLSIQECPNPMCLTNERIFCFSKTPISSIPEFEKFDIWKSIKAYLPKKLVEAIDLFVVNGPRSKSSCKFKNPIAFVIT